MSYQTRIEELRNFDLGDITDFDTIGEWPGSVKTVLALLVFSGCLAAGYYLHIQKLQQRQQIAANRELTLVTEIDSKAFLAANLEAYREQTIEMEASFTELLRQLPSETEVPGLVDDVTDTGLGSGLEFSNIELSDEIVQEIYIELPIEFDVEGSYHDFATFVSGVASLGRIVTLHDFSIANNDNEALDMHIVAKTYRYKNQTDSLIVAQ
jgi:type IV pilus assembly protein PilO